MKKKLMFVFGTRPEAIKMVPVIMACQKQPDHLNPIIVVTGQHRQMLDQVLRLFAIKPKYDLEIMSDNQTLSDIVNRTLTGLTKIIEREKPDMLLVQGDTSTAFAAGLAAFYQKVHIGHVEAGLRTFDKWQPYPEEINRKLLTALADLHFAPTQTSVDNLVAEKVSRETIFLTGNSVIDALLMTAEMDYDLAKTGIQLDPTRKLVLVTCHRRENLGPPLENICHALLQLAQVHVASIEIVLPVHRNPQVRDVIKKLLGKVANIKLVEPLDYEPFVHLMKAAYIILTDSGGVQEEAPALGKPVLVMREKTERPEAVTAGTVKLVGADDKLIFSEANELLTDRAAYDRMSQAVNPYGDGLAAERIIRVILYRFGRANSKPAEFVARKTVKQ
ncbi:UDP-N-acetylglucosamine 2-epimerase (non-hydrolyzing) [Candidatus Saganbacteria bacterium]|nr:UDP-N-acetylglucosamine 2-epimerase (non-hydrolyzing) [Candidatus Saganbacteria bacterium]